MNFNSVGYMLFLPLVVILYYKIPEKYKNIYLLVVSYYFYLVTASALVFILPLATVVSFLSGKFIQKLDGNKRKYIFILAILFNISLLFMFKYYNFFMDSISAVFDITFTRSSLILPLGLSYFTFQSISYISDIYLQKYKAEENFIDYAVYLSFFPYVTMGPISRADKILPQLKQPKSFDYSSSVSALQLIAIGLFKKIAVADVLAMVINEVNGNVTNYTGLMLIFTAVLFSFQLYGDFSGYSDIARGSAKLLGIDIIDNFNTPYLSTSFSQFWTRWHISLSSWFQDYIFTPFVWTNPLKNLPLIGKFFTSPPVLVAIAIVFLTSGLWHGSAWTFVIWGALHAIYRICEDLMRKYYKKPDKKPKPLKFWGKVVWVFSLVTFSQIFFASSSVENAIYYIKHLFVDLSFTTFQTQYFESIKNGFDATPILIYAYIAFTILTLLIMIGMDFYRHFKLKGKCLTTAFLMMKPWQRWLCYYALIAFIMAGFIINNGGYGASSSFIYNNF